MNGHRLSDPHSHIILCFAPDTLEDLKWKEAEAVSGRESYKNVFLYNPHLSFAYFLQYFSLPLYFLSSIPLRIADYGGLWSYLHLVLSFTHINMCQG